MCVYNVLTKQYTTLLTQLSNYFVFIVNIYDTQTTIFLAMLKCLTRQTSINFSRITVIASSSPSIITEPVYLQYRDILGSWNLLLLYRQYVWKRVSD